MLAAPTTKLVIDGELITMSSQLTANVPVGSPACVCFRCKVNVVIAPLPDDGVTVTVTVLYPPTAVGVPLMVA